MKLFFVFLLGIAPCWALANNLALKYSPARSELTGTLELQTFPGPPSFESVKDGDEVERYFFLRLDPSVSVVLDGPHPNVENAQTERNVKVVQLSIDAEDDGLWKRFRKTGPGQRVKVEGTLFHQFTGHHHSRVLLDVNKLKVLGDR